MPGWQNQKRGRDCLDAGKGSVMNKFRIIQVGSSGWGESWLQFIHESPDWELAGLVSRGGDQLRAAQEKWNIPAQRVFDSLEKALAAPGDVVLIAAPHHLHVPMARQALAAGRNVLIEKPLSDNFDEARALADFARGCKGRAWVSQNYRYREGLWRLHRSLAEGRLGRLISIRLNFRRAGKNKPGPWAQEWRRQQWSFLLNELVIHHFDMCRFLSGNDAEWIFCDAWKHPWNESAGPESAAAVIRFNDGWTLDFDGHARTIGGPTTEFGGDWLVQTDHGCALWNGGDVEWSPVQGEESELADAEGFPGFDRAGVLNELAAAIQGKPTRVLPTLEDNLRSLAMVFAAIHSAQEGRVVKMSELLTPPGSM